MFANEDSMLEYFYECGEALTLTQLESKFDNSPREEILEVVTSLEKRNFVKYLDSALWAITDVGVAYFKRLRNSKKTNIETIAPVKTLIEIAIAVITGLIVVYLAYKFGWN